MTHMLIKDPYLHSQQKEQFQQPLLPPPPSSFPLPHHNTSTHSQPVYPDPIRNRAVSTGEVYELQGRVKAYEKEIRNMEHAYIRQEEAARKMLNYNEVNREYHEAMRARNFELNTKLREAVGQVQLVQQRSTEEHVRSSHDKDMLLKKYEEQAEEYLRLRANYNALLEQKTRLQEEVSHLSFLLEKEAHQYELQAKEQALRMESMDRTYRALVAAKEEEVAQLTLRLRGYEDENRKLMDINRTLQLTKDRPLDNLSQINPLDSHLKSRTHLKDRDKENEDANLPQSHSLPHHQKAINDDLRSQIDNLKKQLKEITHQNSLLQQQQEQEGERRREGEGSKREGEVDLLQTSKWQGLMASVCSIRQGLNKQIFQIFYKSIKEGERRKQNSLVLFIENWRALQIDRLSPYIQSYFQVRNNLKAVADSRQAKESVHFPKMQEVIPLQVGSRANRSNINQWILSTIQFTKNQKEGSKKCFNNCLLFLFRLLTIHYRIKYPMQGKTYHLDHDVTNQLMHEIIKAVQAIFQYS